MYDFLKEKLHESGEHPFFFETAIGPMEAVLTSPRTLKTGYLALLGHPHSLQGGTMNNKVVTTLVRAFKEKGIPVIRFNFRGVGNSAGVFDGGVGEAEDLLQLAAGCKQLLPDTKIILAGFSFGSYVTYRAAASINTPLLLSVAPPVTHFNFKEFLNFPENWHIIQGDVDEVIDEKAVRAFAQDFSPPLFYHLFKTGHFFHGLLLDLKEMVLEIINDLFRQDDVEEDL